MSDKKQHIPQEAKDIFELINTTKSAFFDIAGNGAKIASSAVNNSITITLEATDGKSWDQIAGKLIGTAIDYGAINLITRFKPIKDIVEKNGNTGKIVKNLGVGYGVFGFEKTDYSMADYFEKALPKAISFYKKIATDKEFAKDILNEIKNVADTDQFVEYYKNFTLEQFMADFKALLSVNDENNSQILRHSKRCEESQKNLQNTCHSKPLTCHSEFLQSKNEESKINSQILCHSERSEESKINLQNVTSQNSQKWELTFNEKYVIKDFAHKLYGVKMPETKQRIGADAATQCKISLF